MHDLRQPLLQLLRPVHFMIDRFLSLSLVFNQLFTLCQETLNLHEKLFLFLSALVQLSFDLLALSLHPLLSVVTFLPFVVFAADLLLQPFAFSRHHSLFLSDVFLFFLNFPDLRL